MEGATPRSMELNQSRITEGWGQGSAGGWLPLYDSPTDLNDFDNNGHKA